LQKAPPPWPDGTEKVVWTLIEAEQHLIAEVSLIMGEPVGVVRVFRLPHGDVSEKTLIYEKPIGLIEIAMFAADREDLITTFMEAVVKEAQPH